MRTVSLIFVTFGFISCFVQAQPEAPAATPAGIKIRVTVCKQPIQCSYDLYTTIGDAKTINQKIAWTSCDAATTPDGAYSFEKGTTKRTLLMKASSCGGGAFQTLEVGADYPGIVEAPGCATYYGTLCADASK